MLLLEDYALVWCSGNSFYYCIIRCFGHELIELAKLFIFLFINSNVGIFCYLFAFVCSSMITCLLLLKDISTVNLRARVFLWFV